ncbi:hypothetical protein EMCRGX_G003769 [Ephydatia muelleri]
MYTILIVQPCLVSSLFYCRGGLVLAMGAMWVVVAAARGAAREVLVGALVSILVPVVGLVLVAAVLLLLLLVAAGEALLLLLLAVGAVGPCIVKYKAVFKQSIFKAKPELQPQITSNDNVPFIWALVSAGWVEEGEEGQALLEQIIDQYVTVRGFSIASRWMKKYKQEAQKKSTQKSKGIRKQLC